MEDFKENEKYLFEDLGIDSYEQMLKSDEKFKIWESKTFAERQSVFNKVSLLGRYSKDLLSVWVAEQMDILLDKSVLGRI